MSQLARLWVEPGVPEIKRRLRARKRPLEIRFSFRGSWPRVGALVEGDGASCFPCFVGQIRCLHRHSKPPPKSPTPSVLKVDLFLEATLTSRVLGGVGFERGSSGAPKGSLLVVPFFLNRHAHSMTQLRGQRRGG